MCLRSYTRLVGDQRRPLSLSRYYQRVLENRESRTLSRGRAQALGARTRARTLRRARDQRGRVACRVRLQGRVRRSAPTGRGQHCADRARETAHRLVLGFARVLLIRDARQPPPVGHGHEQSPGPRLLLPPGTRWCHQTLHHHLRRPLTGRLSVHTRLPTSIDPRVPAVFQFTRQRHDKSA